MAKERPDPRPLRLAFGVSGIAAATAMATGILDPAQLPAPAASTEAVAVVAPTPEIRHVVRYVHLAPGETAPPNAVLQTPLPLPPRVLVITTTRQSGTP